MTNFQTPFTEPAGAAITAANLQNVPGDCVSPDKIRKTGLVLCASANDDSRGFTTDEESDGSTIVGSTSSGWSIHSKSSISSRSTISESNNEAIIGSILEALSEVDVASVTDTDTSEKASQDASPVTQDSSGDASSKKSWISLLLKTKIRKHNARKLEEKRRKAIEAEQARLESVQVAVDFIQKFVVENWETNCENGHVKITCDITMDEMEEIGRLEQKEGWRECLKLIKAPFIHDAIGLGLWQELAKQVLENDALKPENETAVMKKPTAQTEMAVIEKPPGDLVKGTDPHKRKREPSVQLEDDGRRSVPKLATKRDRIESAPADISIFEKDRINSDVSTPPAGPDQVREVNFGGIIRRDEEQNESRRGL
ncbi:hypothetical protein CKAH01_14899 [Colletotrichum kahawae]|uniref:Uncharacterized protein n=1 Tax=Colletotrichum kahawae TaxID=34407 RepID=A0AAD9YLK4_COLKA|nr:hypothetical protein CKAH01_14899 [Colletotrichum kahawae]